MEDYYTDVVMKFDIVDAMNNIRYRVVGSIYRCSYKFDGVNAINDIGYFNCYFTYRHGSQQPGQLAANFYPPPSSTLMSFTNTSVTLKLFNMKHT